MPDTIPPIRFETYIPHPERPGYLKYDGTKSRESIEGQIHQTLKAIPFDEASAYDYAEWVSIEGKYDPSDWHVPSQGAPIVYYRHGGSEGFIITICIVDKSKGTYHDICHIKYLSDEDAVHAAVKHLIGACHDGLFGEG
jgi:hypothetical protein